MPADHARILRAPMSEGDARGAPAPARARALRVAHVAVSPLAYGPLEPMLASLEDHGFEVLVVSTWAGHTHRGSGRAIDVPFVRTIDPLRDVAALVALVQVLRAEDPDIVHAHTPKGGLLGMLAATLARVPIRVYHVHGLPDGTVAPLRRFLWRAGDALSCRLATHVLAVGPGIREGLARRRVARSKLVMLNHGSAGGVDLERFAAVTTRASRRAARARLGLPDDARVVGFVGRLTPEKGVAELLAAWARFRVREPRGWLLVVGPEEGHAPLTSSQRAELLHGEHVTWLGMRDDVEHLYPAMDVLILPSHREGVPTVVLEASAAGVPVVASAVVGTTDVVRDGETGLLVALGDAEGAARALERLFDDEALRERLVRTARAQVVRRFSARDLASAMVRFYDEAGAGRLA